MGDQRKLKTQAPCTDRDKNKVPMNGYCRVENVVYKLAVSTTEKSKEHDYIDVADSPTTIKPCHSEIRGTKIPKLAWSVLNVAI